MQEQLLLNGTPKRHCAKWSYSEVDKLHREFEIKQYTVEKIALKHERTPNAILFKLKSEGLLEKEETDDDEDDESDNEDSETEDDDTEDDDDEDYEDDDDDEDYEEESEDDESYVDEEEEEEEDDEEEREREAAIPCTYQINVLRTNPTNLVEKCIFTYFKAINILVDVIFDTSYGVYRRVFAK